MKKLDEAILIHDMIEEFQEMLSKLLKKLDTADFFRFAYETGYAEEQEPDEDCDCLTCRCELK